MTYVFDFDRRAIAYVDNEAIVHNIEVVRGLLGGAEIMAMIKADAYAHGSTELARVFTGAGVKWLGVATAEEGQIIRESGVVCPMLIVGYTPEESVDAAIESELTQTVFSLETARMIDIHAAKQNKTADIHIKIDTGMGRLGFYDTEEAAREILEIAKLKNVHIGGIYTHLANSDEQNDGFTRGQAERFISFTDKLKDLGLKIPLRHISNSAAVVNYPELNMDLVRAGGILYGLSPSIDDDWLRLGLKPALEWRSYVCYVKTVEAGTTIGYGRRFKAEKPMRIATIPIGYGDGYNRLLSNRGVVLINGEYAPVVGNICMDQFMVDVSHIPNVGLGDEVILIGTQGDKTISASDIAKQIGTISYEVVCAISKRVHRVYKGVK